MNIKMSVIGLGLVLSNLAFSQVQFEGRYIVDGDLAFPDLETLARYQQQEALDSNKLIVNLKGLKSFDVWSSAKKSQITYCVSDEFKTKKRDVVEALQVATQDWMDVANVKFSYVPSEDANCDSKNANVVFDVRPVNVSGRFIAVSFFPSYAREKRSLFIDASAFRHSQVALSGFVRHEAGHILGFRHEHISKDSPGLCPEDSNFQPVTAYDNLSVMHYPQCGGKNNIENMILSELDKEGARKVYP